MTMARVINKADLRNADRVPIRWFPFAGHATEFGTLRQHIWIPQHIFFPNIED